MFGGSRRKTDAVGLERRERGLTKGGVQVERIPHPDHLHAYGSPESTPRVRT